MSRSIPSVRTTPKPRVENDARPYTHGMNRPSPSHPMVKKLVSAALVPILALSSVFNALPALGQVEITPRAALTSGVASGVRSVPAALGSVHGLPVLAAPSALSVLAPTAMSAAAIPELQ